jgi:hypothetical protein
VSLNSTSGLKSQRGIGGMLPPPGAGSGAWMPGSRNGRGVPVTTRLSWPLLLEVALASSTLPSVAAITVKLCAVTRMPSTRSSWSSGPEGLGKSGVSCTGAGSALPAPTKVTVGAVISVRLSWPGSAGGRNSTTVPCTMTSLPICAVVGGVAPV